MFNWEKMKMGRNCFNILRVFMWKKELNLSAPVSIMNSNDWNLQGGRFQNFVTLELLKNRMSCFI